MIIIQYRGLNQSTLYEHSAFCYVDILKTVLFELVSPMTFLAAGTD